MPDLQEIRTLLDPPVWVVVLLLAALVVLPPLVRRSWRRAEYALLLAGIALAGLVGEAGCRLLDLGAPAVAPVWIARRAHAGEFAYLMQPDSELQFAYPDDPRGYFGSTNRIVSRVNSQGFRGREAAPDRPPGSLRIAVLGDSFTLGTGVRDKDTLPARLEAALAPHLPGVEVLNFGIGGTDTARQVELLEHQVLSYRPDLVLVVVFLNDTGRAGTVSLLSKPWILPGLRQHSRFLNALLRPIERGLLHRAMVRHYRRGFASGSPGWRTVRQALRRARALCAGHACELRVAVYPVLFGLDGDYPFRGVHATIAAFCEQEGIPFVDLLPALEGHDPKQLWVHRIDQHPNDVAHGLAADHLATELRRQGLDRGRPPAAE